MTETYRAYVLEQLRRVRPDLRHRAMYGGVGIWAGPLFFALISDDALYFRVDDSNRGDFESRGLEPFRPGGNSAESMSYYAIPEDVLEDPDTLRVWAERAIAVALRRRAGKSRRSGA
jgi:DNA transformation protein